MIAAITAAKAGARVTLFERNDRVGKKILMTGNGKCNLGNSFLNPDMYYTDRPDFVKEKLEKFGTAETISFFNGIGLMIKEKNGYLYPASEQASTVLNVLRNEIKRLGINVVTQCMVKDIKGENNSGKITIFTYNTEGRSKWTFDSVIIACGGMAAPATGSDGNGYELAKKIGHKIKMTVPALVQLKCKESFFKAISGVRADAKVILYDKDTELCNERGELQLTDYGVSGIPVFQLSRVASYALKKSSILTIHIDFLPDINKDDYRKLCADRRILLNNMNVEEFFTGMLNKKLMQLFIKLAGLKGDESIEKADSSKVKKVFEMCKDFSVTVSDTNPYTNAQVTAGGVRLSEITDNFESNICPGVFFAGEILDVDGKCGGYNLQWAWTSGYIAGISAAGN